VTQSLHSSPITNLHQRSPPWLFAAAAWSGLRLAPEKPVPRGLPSLPPDSIIEQTWAQEEYADLARAWYPSVSVEQQRAILQHNQSACGGVPGPLRARVISPSELADGSCQPPTLTPSNSIVRGPGWMRLPQVYHTPPANAVWSCYVRIRSTSRPEIEAFLFSALDAGCFSAAGNWRTVPAGPLAEASAERFRRPEIQGRRDCPTCTLG
jgi:hypothetical protein